MSVETAHLPLGKRAAKHDPRTVRLSRFLTSELAPAPQACDWSAMAKRLGPMKNNEIGDCGLAAPGHYIQRATAENGAEFVPDDADIEKAYADVGGYVYGRPETDGGIILLDGMNYWRGTGIAGHRIEGYAALELKNREHFKQAIYVGGGVILGFSLPESAKNQSEWFVDLGGDLLDPTPGSWGGHAVDVFGYDDNGILFISWGIRMFATWDFVDACADEAYVPISPDWSDWNGSPSGFLLPELRLAIAEVAA